MTFTKFGSVSDLCFRFTNPANFRVLICVVLSQYRDHDIGVLQLIRVVFSVSAALHRIVELLTTCSVSRRTRYYVWLGEPDLAHHICLQPGPPGYENQDPGASE